MMRFASHANRLIGQRWGESFPFYYVSEYPRSGGTWLGRMIADYLEIPYPSMAIFPQGCEAVIHNHWGYTPGLVRSYYISRDGRDVVVSAFFHISKNARAAVSRSEQNYFRSRYPYFLDSGFKVDEARDLMPRFIEDWVFRPTGCRYSWPDHVLQWTQNRPNVHTLTYEALRSNPMETLGAALDRHTGAPTDQEKLRATVLKYSFERQTGRKPGEEDATDDKRKGLVGDWRNYFSLEAAKTFERLCGRALVHMGYERSSDWVDSLQP